MAITNQLLALLSLDTYNRGYDAQLSDTLSDQDLDGLGGEGSQLGLSKII